MKKILIFLIALSVQIPILNIYADNDVRRKIPLSTGPLVPKENRSLVLEPIECYFYGIMNLIQTNVYSDLGEVQVSIINETTGESWNSFFDSGQNTQSILSISGNKGSYEVLYITESGIIYEGNFTIE